MESRNNEFLNWETSGTKRPRRIRKIEREWLPNDVRLLIHLVEQRKVLWDPSKSNHKDSKLRENTFQSIAKTLDRTTPDCKAKWDNLRNQYRSYQAKANHNIEVKWQYFESLSFLQNVCEPRKSKGNSINLGLNDSNDTISIKRPLSQSHMHFMDDLDTCSSSFSTSTHGVKTKEELNKSPEVNDRSKSDKTDSPPETNHNHNSPQIFGDFVADQMRQLKPQIADQLKRNILKLVVDALDKDK
ncbi:uncharacterized protein LOC115761340 [Drosophila novamexicana]|uniref:uncharacterized protein LOC115761340 n=1 Tax=Drosophila novamexicana TaxID=47314 RepID=UPI0011E5CCEF|nr:uncharacterized protein LOC115761340 [Drosophila novamexicana]